MNIIEALEALKCGFSVVAYSEYETTATELFKLVSPDTVELYYPESEKPVDVMSMAKFQKTYTNVPFTVYNDETT